VRRDRRQWPPGRDRERFALVTRDGAGRGSVADEVGVAGPAGDEGWRRKWSEGRRGSPRAARSIANARQAHSVSMSVISTSRPPASGLALRRAFLNGGQAANRLRNLEVHIIPRGERPASPSVAIIRPPPRPPLAVRGAPPLARWRHPATRGTRRSRKCGRVAHACEEPTPSDPTAATGVAMKSGSHRSRAACSGQYLCADAAVLSLCSASPTPPLLDSGRGGFCRSHCAALITVARLFMHWLVVRSMLGRGGSVCALPSGPAVSGPR